MNLVILIGNVGQDIELTTFQNGGKIARSSLATNKTYRNSSGETVSHTEWHNIEASGKLADVFNNYVKKGDKIRISGELQTKSYEKEDVKHYVTRVRISEVEFLTPKQGGSDQTPPINEPNVFKGDDDLPF